MINLKALSLLGVAGLVLAGAETTQAQITKQGDAYLFRIKFTPGQTIKYLMNMNMTGTPQPMNMNMTVSQKVKSVKGTTATIEATTSGIPGQKPMTQTMTIDNRGRATGAGAAGGSQVAYPEGPVKVGQTWKGQLPGMGQGMGGDATYKLVAIKTVNGKQVAQVSLSMNLSQGTAMKMSGTGTMYIFMSDGSLSTMSMNTNMSMKQDKQTMNMKMNMTMKRG
ncbi:MAG: hypothetical protein JNJ45_09375 [Chthonomonas sp.]|nr:hypothetical protein [Chthonomonas sp.]